jgi:2-phosphosulfolactate phosphatase
MPKLEVCLSPALLHLNNFADSIVVIIDVFRATSTIAAVIDNGANCIIPVDDVEKCKQLGQQIPNSITAGERNGKIIEGLDHGNSPTEYPKDYIANKTLVLTTTNGTRLLHQAKDCKQIITGSFLNLKATCDYLQQQNENVLLACSSWKDRFNIEDTIYAGAIIEQIGHAFDMNDDSARASLQLWRGAKNDLNNFIKNTSHYIRLSQYNLQEDMHYCCEINKHDVLVKYIDGKLIKG